jgi:acetolactate synthase-1/2/3 large subunit
VPARADVAPAVEAAARTSGPVLLEFRVDQDDQVYPMVAPGADLHQMIRRPPPFTESAADAWQEPNR